MSNTAIAEALAPYEGREQVPWHEVGEQFGLSRRARSYAVTSGAVRPLAGPGGRAGYMLAADEVRRVVIAAVIAAAAGVAIVTILRALDSAGLSVEALAAALPQT